MTETLFEEIVEDLRGTCNSLDTVLDRHTADDLFGDQAFHDYLDSQIFCCVTCQWWCEISEEASEDFGLEEWTCLECCEEEGEEE